MITLLFHSLKVPGSVLVRIQPILTEGYPLFIPVSAGKL